MSFQRMLESRQNNTWIPDQVRNDKTKLWVRYVLLSSATLNKRKSSHIVPRPEGKPKNPKKKRSRAWGSRVASEFLWSKERISSLNTRSSLTRSNPPPLKLRRTKEKSPKNKKKSKSA